MDCFQSKSCFSKLGRRLQTSPNKMSKSARSQSLPRSPKTPKVRHEGFFARLKRRLRISSKKSYSVGESDGIVSTEQYVPRSSRAFSEGQVMDPISYSEMGHNLACSLEGSNPNESSIVRVRAESQKSTLENGLSPKIFSSSQEELGSNAFILSEEHAVDLDDVFIANNSPLSDGEIPEIMEEPGYETLDNIQKQIKDKKAENALAGNSFENGGIAVKTDFQRGEDAGNIRGQMSKTSLDSGLGSPEQGTQSPNLESEGECPESVPCRDGDVKVGTQMVRSFHTVHGAPDVNVSHISEDDIYANAQIPIRKKSVKKSQSEPDNVVSDRGDSEAVSQLSGSAPSDRDSTMPPPLPERCYSLYMDDSVNSLVPAPQEQLGLVSSTSIPPPLPDRKYSTSDLVGMESLGTEHNDIDKLGDNRNKICDRVIAEKAASSVTVSGSNGALSHGCDGGEDKTAHDASKDRGVPGNNTCQLDKSKCSSTSDVKGSLPVESTSSGGTLSKVGVTGNCSGSNLSRKLRAVSRRSDKTVVEVSFGAVKLREEVDGPGVLPSSKSDSDSSVCNGGGNSKNVGVLGQAGSADTVDSVKAVSQRADMSTSCSVPGNTANVHVVNGGSGEKQHVVMPVESSPPTIPSDSGSCGACEKSAVQESSKISDPDSASVPLPMSSDSSPSSGAHAVLPRSVIGHCVAFTNTNVSQDSGVPHSVLQRSAPIDPNSASSISSMTKSGVASSMTGPNVTTTNSDTSDKITDCVLWNAINESCQNSASASQVAEPEANQTNAKSAESLPREGAAEMMCCGNVDTDDLYRDDEPIHMSLQEVFGLSPVLPEKNPKRRSRMQIDSDSILAFQESMQQLKECGWYWGPLNSIDAEHKLANKPNGSFLVRDSANENYILSITFKSSDKVHHTRIEHFKGKFSFWSQPESHGKNTIKEFIDQAMENSRNGQFRYFLRAQGPGMPPVSMYLLYPVSRFKTMRSLMHMCRFTILQIVRRDHVDCLPIPLSIKKYLKEHQYYAEIIDDDADDVVGFDQNENHTTRL